MKVALRLNKYKNDQMNRVYDPCEESPTALVVSGGGREIKIIDDGGSTMKKLRKTDFFCGGGGMGLGFKYAGFDISQAFDNNPFAVRSYNHNVSNVAIEQDVSTLTWRDMAYSDVWTFGFPCTDLSIAGKGEGMLVKCVEHEHTFDAKDSEGCPECGSSNLVPANRSGMFFAIMNLLKDVQEHVEGGHPSILVAENVPKLKAYLPVVEAEYKKRGYKMYVTMYNSKWWGVPQSRDRYFVVGVHESIDKEFVFPEQQQYFVPRLSTVLEPEVDESFFINDEKTLKILEQVKDGLKVKEATKIGFKTAVEGDAINVSHPNSKTRRGRVGHQIAQTLITRNEQVVVLGNAHPVQTPERTYKNQNGRRAKADEEPMYTLTTGDKHGVVERGKNGDDREYRIRKLTPREYARLQGFPDSYEIIVSKSQAYGIFGNAVTVNVAQAIAERIKMFLLSL